MHHLPRVSPPAAGVRVPGVPSARAAPGASRAEVEAAVALVRCDYQPIVDLDSRDVVGYEALARGPQGPLQHPSALFAAAAAHGLTARLDWACRRAALAGARAARLPGGLELFVNVEPAVMGRPLAAGVEEQSRLFDGLSLTVEITERGLSAHLPGLLRSADWLRSKGWRIALDDVGADPASLALLPVIRPEVIKLDLRLVQSGTTTDVAAVITAVNAEAERTGAEVLAEGIETAEHAELAQMMGARLGQGWYYGHPAPMPLPLPPGTTRRAPTVAGPVRGPGTPFALVGRRPDLRRTGRPLLAAISDQLWRQADAVGEPAVVLCSFGTGRITDDYLRRYAGLARTCSYVAVLGPGLPDRSTGGLHTRGVDEDSPLAPERVLLVLGPHFAGALLAREVPGSGEPRFDYVVTYDRPTVLAAIRVLVDQLT